MGNSLPSLGLQQVGTGQPSGPFSEPQFLICEEGAKLPLLRAVVRGTGHVILLRWWMVVHPVGAQLLPPHPALSTP